MKGFVAGWLVIVSAGIFCLARYDGTPAPAHGVAAVWPAKTAVDLDRTRATLVIAVHPRCSCTHASLNELARMLPRMREARIVILLLESDKLQGREAEFREVASGLRAELVPDRNGREASLFGLTTSGEVAVYGPHGDLLYSGGITGMRGHEGDNPGEEGAIAAVNRSSTSQPGMAPVFGCSLKADNQ